MTVHQADVIVVGAGPSGSACAAELARQGVEVLLLHDGTHAVDSVETTQPGATGVITSILGPVLGPPHSMVPGARSSWADPALVETDFLFDPSDGAWAVERSAFDAAARDAAIERGARLVPARVTSVEREGDGWQVGAADGEVFGAGFVVDATGRAGAIVRRLGARVGRQDGLVAMVGEGRPGADTRDGTLVESVEDGWWYATTLGDRASIGLVTHADLLPPAGERDAVWRMLLGQTRHLRGVVSVDEDVFVRTRRADMSLTEPRCGEGWLAVGDAAAAWDPLSSQGLVAGILLAGRAARAIVGGEDAIEEWQDDVQMLAEDTVGLQREYYRMETRWPDAPFWRQWED
jgi:flavin-dependent dehydrogenase